MEEEEGGWVLVFFASRKVLRLFLLESYGALVAVSAPLVMPTCDSDILMNVPFPFRNKQPLPRLVRGGGYTLFVSLNMHTFTEYHTKSKEGCSRRSTLAKYEGASAEVIRRASSSSSRRHKYPVCESVCV